MLERAPRAVYQPLHETGLIIGWSTGGEVAYIQKIDVGSALEKVADTQGNPPRASRGAVPEHMADLYGRACGSCTSSTERQVLAQLLKKYSDVFSRGDGGMGLTKVISYEISWQLAPPPLGSQSDV